MYRTDNSTRQVFQRMHRAGKSTREIATAIGRTVQTVNSLKKLSDEELFTEPNKSTRTPSFDIEKLRQYITDNPFAYNTEIGRVFNKGKSTIHRWRHRLGFKRKKAKTTYKESDVELKKTLQ
jgi:transposase